MRKMIAGLMLSALAARAGAVEVTVYNQNLGLVKDERRFDLKAGESELRLSDVAAQIDPTSVHFKSLSAPDAVAVLEQDFQYDLISQQKILEKYVGKEIELERYAGPNGEKRETLKGTLLSASDGKVLLADGKIYLNPPGNPVLGALPEGLLTRPTLVWKLKSEKSGPLDCELSYLTSGMGWQADYVLVASSGDDKMDLNAWVTVNNNSGAAYKDAKLKLVAGDVHRAEQGGFRPMMGRKVAAFASGIAPAFAENAFFEYHLYTLSRPTTLAENETKQIELASAAGVPLKKLFIYDGAQGVSWTDFNEYSRLQPDYGAQGDKKVAVVLQFKNAKDQGLGLPLPKGRVRVYKKDEGGALEFIGEDAIDHTPKDEDLRIRMGSAFDLVGERKRTSFQINVDKNRLEETFELRVRNHKDRDAVVKVVEHLYRWSNWKILDASRQWTKKDAQTIEFELPIPKDGEGVITYTVKYSW